MTSEDKFIEHLRTLKPASAEELQERIRGDIQNSAVAERSRLPAKYESRSKLTFIRGVVAGTCVGLALGLLIAGLGLRYIFPQPSQIEIVYVPHETKPTVAEKPAEVQEKPAPERALLADANFQPYWENSVELKQAMATYRLRARLAEVAGNVCFRPSGPSSLHGFRRVVPMENGHF